ncbi:MAG TPA: prolyl oligopeptidase family serine peptidase, partial [Holophagaceae bacterium]
ARKDDAVVVDDVAHLVPLGLWELDLGTRKLQRLGVTRDRIGAFQVSPDGRYAVALHDPGTRWEYDQQEVPRTRVWDLDRGTSVELPVDVHQVPDAFAWAADSRSFYALYRHFTHPAFSQVGVEAAYRASAPGWKPVALPLAWDRGFGPFLQALDGRLLACLEDGLIRRMAFLDPAGGAPRLLANPAEGHPMLVLADASGTKGAALLSSARRPPEWYAVTFGPKGLEVRRRLTHLNPHLEGKAFARVEPYHVAGAEGPVEGLLYYPADYRPGRAYPLVLNPHGGPGLNDRDEWNENEHHPCQLHAQAGAFVLQLNYSGSTGYGLAFAERLMGRYLGPELVDLKQAMADLVGRGLVDPRRIGLTGWSNGAILGWALLADSPFPLRAASLGAGDVNFVSDWSNCQFGASFDGYYLGASLVDAPDLYWRRSILPRLGGATTPTIIFHGERDREVPTEQAWQGYRFLQQAGKAPVRLVLFPGEEHEFKQPVHILRKLEEEMAWFDRYLYAAPRP